MEIKPIVTKADHRAALKEIESLMSARQGTPTATDSMSWQHWSKPGRRNVFRWIDQSADSQERIYYKLPQ
jgi:hypothetical protein